MMDRSPVEIIRLNTTARIAQLGLIPDAQLEKEEGVLHSELVQYLLHLQPEQLKDFGIAAAMQSGEIIGYGVVQACIVPPFGRRMWGLNLSSKNPEAVRLLIEESERFAEEHGLKRGALCTRSMRAVERFKQCGWLHTGALMEKAF